MKKFHYKLYLPEDLSKKIPRAVRPLVWSYHAKIKAQQRNIPLIPAISTHCGKIVEVTTNNNLDPISFLLEMDFNKNYKLSLSLIISRNYFLVKTVWLNHISDTHENFRREMYENGLCNSLQYSK